LKYLLLVVASLLSFFPMNAMAAQKQSAKINFSDVIVVAGTQLKPGDYTIRWDGASSDVQVQFLRDSKEIVSAPAKLVNQHHDVSPVIATDSTSDGVKTLKEVRLSKISLQFSK
jgi:hypothetical protein